MNFKTLSFLCILFSAINVIGQEVLEEQGDQPGQMRKDDYYGIFTLGFFQPITFGNNFAHEGLSQKGGWSFDFLFNVAESKILLGLNCTYFKNQVIQPALVGNYKNTNTTSIGPQFGYHFITQRHWRATAVMGIGAVIYRSSYDNEIFSDNGTSLWLKPTLSYQFTKNFGVFGSISYRHDFLNIDAPPGYNAFFKNANYIGLSTGVRIII
ncbi:hypothetical protein [Aegicerativicinus sediminis]